MCVMCVCDAGGTSWDVIGHKGFITAESLGTTGPVVYYSIQQYFNVLLYYFTKSISANPVVHTPGL